MKQGSICLIHFPFSDNSGKKVRPVVIVSKEKVNQGEDVLVCAITSNTKGNGILINNTNLQEGVLYKNYLIKAFSLHAMEKSLFIKEIALLDKKTMFRVRREIVEFF